MSKEYRVALTKTEWEYVLNALEEYIGKYELDAPELVSLEDEESLEMVECTLGAYETIKEKYDKL